VRLLVLVSGGGTNLQALIDAERAGGLGAPGHPAHIVGVISDRPGVFALERASKAGIPCFLEKPDLTLPKADRRKDLSTRLLERAKELDAELVFLAGFLSILTEPFVSAYAGRMLNLHPALLPKFGGPGMYGERVHEAVLAAGERESGCTVHWVDAGTDTGPILLQRKVPVLEGDSPETLAERIHEQEHRAVVEAVTAAASACSPRLP